MEKVIKIGDKDVRLNNNISWTMEYRDQFGKDIVPVIMPMFASVIEMVSTIVNDSGGDIKDISAVTAALEGRSMEILLPMFQTEFVDLIINVAWSMAKAADENIEPPKRWIRQFEEFPLDVIVPTIFEMALKGSISSKNLKRLKTAGENLKVLQPLHSTTSSSQDLSED